ncbi:MAG TPA: FAD:protein FMN transferase [Chitinophagaceae bacterium]|nr:FAD:protein FMN transferase [Chitinophagaceae bacterium]
MNRLTLSCTWYWRALVLLGSGAWLAGPSPAAAQALRFRFTRPKMGSPFNLTLFCTDSSRAARLADSCYALVDSLNGIYSDYDPQSEVSRLAARPGLSQPQALSPELLAMLLRCRQAWFLSRGSFDVSIGALTHCWRAARAAHRFPDRREIRRARRAGGFRHLDLDPKACTLQWDCAGMQLDLGGIVKGYAAQRVIDFLRGQGITCALADAGGDLAVLGTPPGQRGWRIGVNLPGQADSLWRTPLQLDHGAVATSGDLYRYILHRGRRYSHLIDPRTGYGVTTGRNVTVVATDGAEADWLATACSILPLRRARRLADARGAALLIAEAHKGRIRTYPNAAWVRLLPPD